MIDYTKAYSSGVQNNIDEGLRTYMLRIYNLMAVALFITAIAATATFSLEPIARLMFHFSPNGYVIGQTPIGLLVNIAPIGIALYFFWGIGRLDISTAQVLFWIYSALVGMSLSALGYIYTGESLVSSFFVTASAFAIMSIYGHSTKKDLTSFGSLLTMGLFGIIIASLVNIFLGSAAIHFATSILGVGIFMGLIAWDTQKLKHIYYNSGGGELGQKLAVVGAFTLYLDFINLFLYVLRFLGNRRKD
ncbi:inhibitor of apoptosis-promoting Bax1 family protein [Orientia chuto str. Dubai]|uniref:Inhibitor of apoptosis-promoting Bax1 family protein n=1 Tax=Orientia chuto str. Dubai TaxID=1359168 RepID=A0A0F3MN59_9RICK|nr:Bax inhibitor-1/YccA family protein [Candidatus Orientia mediorientalis]KJV57165.1 inhibitor of apoptosis-promoting Bax1 family protein [Orientia chuto str. Dubai]